MFNAEEAARLILSKDKGGDDKSEGAPTGAEAMKAVFEAMQSGDFQTAYDALCTAVESRHEATEAEEPATPEIE